MRGKLSIREEESAKLLLDGVIPLADARKAASSPEYPAPPPGPVPPPEERGSAAPRARTPSGRGRLYLKLDSRDRQRVLDVLKETPGGIEVLLYLEDEKKTLRVPREYYVDEGYDFGMLADIVGPESIVFKR